MSLKARLAVPMASGSLWLVAGVCAPQPAPPPFERTEVRADCDDTNPLRNPYFGDTHVHTAFSVDANLQGTRGTPDDAYAFAKGAPLGIQPYDVMDNPTRVVQLERPLDFVAVSDHAEWLGEVWTCTTPAAPGYDHQTCIDYRNDPVNSFVSLLALAGQDPATVMRAPLCNSIDCVAATGTPWNAIQVDAEAHYDRTSACSFTTFVGYEWTGHPSFANLHRNVIFRSDVVPVRPASYFEFPHAEDLWDSLDAECLLPGNGCDALTIPHNSNLGRGVMFELIDRDGNPYDAALAGRKASFEPLVEVVQHKGASECLAGTTHADELCDFEQVPWNNIAGLNLGPPEAQDFVRDALLDGLAQEAALGANPLQFGLIGSTDTHLAAAGLTREDGGHPGHGGAGVPQGGAGLTDTPEYNPGGLAVVWAEENSRDALFTAMRRREAYATSGTRPIVRFFGGWKYPADLCSENDPVLKADQLGVPMGAELAARTSNNLSPKFYVSAAKDPGSLSTPGTDLQRIQIIKGWVDDQGQVQQQVHEVAGDPDNGATVDTATCTPQGAGFTQLCSVWEDPGFDPDQRAFYYARVVENPTCRWSQWQCNAQAVDCAVPATIAPGYEACCDGSIPSTIQERAWTSPIWYKPENSL